MFPGNDRQDVEKGGKSEFRPRIQFTVNNFHSFIHSINYSYYATVRIGSINQIEH